MHCGWSLLAAHVRTNPVHVVVEGEPQPEEQWASCWIYHWSESKSLLRGLFGDCAVPLSTYSWPYFSIR